MATNYQQELPGQGGLVDTPDGRWFWIAQFNRYNSDGRTPCLLPVTWIEDWPVIGDEIKGEFGKMIWQMSKPISSDKIVLPHQSDNFSSPELAPYWSWNHQPKPDSWSLTERKGYLRLYASPAIERKDNFFKVSNVMNQRHMRSDTAIVTVKLDISGMVSGQIAGLSHFNGGKNYSFLAVSITDGRYKKIIYETNGKRMEGPILKSRQKVIYMRSRVGFDNRLTYQYSYDGKSFNDFGEAYTLISGNYRGDMIGLFTYSNMEETGYMDVDWFDYRVSHN